ncbi:hypothetical protein SERLA73DRAFT_189293 [Serpula lacrymans var. lacrymans S7.3]|uniref:Uncharacterized protein n=2 Tax=Serpula lacrymans var. lacrymans TaxID=341189 RepID=F8QDB0_SERL3|nr:uncharacterized protein SERLADRAFT_480044 [Serpula lacrymans var. lacrymans S7.9]EGN93581.1 hypothetical protein SERLA73DRAFT_189293 [Serpula lacrymans var. lacrymans S7.3]EGO18952.1 hypothetical protein SERLADRAFT_480044 [Serpula lacrymans var. lacrymans S7.9]
MKVFYSLARYLPFAMLGLRCYAAVNTSLSYDLCTLFYGMNAWLQTISFLFAELIFVLRTYAIWGHNKRVLVILLGSIFGTFVGIIVLITTVRNDFISSPSPAPMITPCYEDTQYDVISVAYVLLFLLELEILLFTLYRALKHYRFMRSSQLLQVCIQHNIFYFACGSAFSVANIIITFLCKPTYNDYLFSNIQAAAHAMLVARMQINLWKRDQANSEASSEPLSIGQLDFARSLQTTSASITNL